MNRTLEEAIYEKYIIPTQRPAQDFLGVEFEFPLVNLSQHPVNIPAVQEVVQSFARNFGFAQQTADDNGNLYSLTHTPTGDNLSFDCSFNTLELSFGRERSLHVLQGRFDAYIGFLQTHLRRIGHLLTGMGIHPYYRHNTYAPIANDRYRMLYHHLQSAGNYPERHFHSFPEFGMIAAASQVQLDVQEDQILLWLDAYNRLEPYKAVLFANSYFDRLPELSVSRDYLWGASTQGYNPHNLGMYAEIPADLDEYVEFVKSQSIYCVGKHGRYFHFEPTPLYAYLQKESVTGQFYADGGWHTASFRPEVGDIAHHRTFKFADLTYRGTIEFRSACEQPISEAFCHAAFHAGLARNTGALRELLDADRVLYHRGFTASELRELMTHRALPEFVDRAALTGQLIRILDLAREGLHQRGFGEEHYLDPLYERASRLTNPALELIAGLEQGDAIAEWIERYAALKGEQHDNTADTVRYGDCRDGVDEQSSDAVWREAAVRVERHP